MISECRWALRRSTRAEFSRSTGPSADTASSCWAAVALLCNKLPSRGRDVSLDGFRKDNGLTSERVETKSQGRGAKEPVRRAGDYVQLWRTPATGGEEKVLTSGYERLRHCSTLRTGAGSTFSPPQEHLPNARHWWIAATGHQLPESGLFLEEPMISPDGHWLTSTRLWLKRGMLLKKWV